MKTSKNGIQFIGKEEGVILYAYDDANEQRVPIGGSVKGTITIGTGHTSAAGAPKVVPGMTITKAQADTILATDLGKVEADINRLVKVPLNQNQFDALVSFQFNTGGLARASLLTKLNKGDYQGAADGLLAWSKANGNQTLLLKRRQRERDLFLAKPVSDKTSGPAAGTVAGGGLLWVLWEHLHAHPLIASAVALVFGLIVWDVIHYAVNDKQTVPVATPQNVDTVLPKAIQ